ncbi:MAG: hypothetical protein ACTSR3_08560 [Candidatus Helarchaeota archaeon]
MLSSPVEKLFSNYKIYKEIPFFERKIDIIGYRKKEIIAIELKIRDWKSSLWQLLAAQLCANKVYLAIWYKFSKFINFEKLQKYGFGLIEIKKGKAKIILEAQESKILKLDFSREIMKHLKINGQ